MKKAKMVYPRLSPELDKRKKLTLAQVNSIKKEYVPYKVHSYKLAEKYGVSQATILRIVNPAFRRKRVMRNREYIKKIPKHIVYDTWKKFYERKKIVCPEFVKYINRSNQKATKK